MARIDAIYSSRGEPAAGVYDSLVTTTLAERIERWRAEGFLVAESVVDSSDKAEVSHVLGRFVGDAASKALARAKDPVALTNRLLRLLERADDGGKDGDDESCDADGAGTVAVAVAHTVIVVGASDPGTAHRDEAARHPAARPHHHLHGATERDALDRLVRDHGAQVRISYEQRSTRLHAKAWLLRRDTGFDTAYVGSSNLSKAALLDGLEWNVRLSAVATPRLIEEFEATFESYWDSDDFESYDPDRDGDKLSAALAQAGTGTSGKSIHELPVLTPHPYPHQREILEDPDTQRRMWDVHRNLIGRADAHRAASQGCDHGVMVWGPQGLEGVRPAWRSGRLDWCRVGDFAGNVFRGHFVRGVVLGR